MSFILDALKKSEIERQRQNVPGLMDTGPAPRRPRFPVWAMALAALLAVNLAVLVIVLARGGWPSLSARPTAETHAAPAASGAVSATAEAAPSVAAPGPASAAPTPPLASTSSASSPAPLPQSVPTPAAAAAAPAAADSNLPEHHISPMDAAAPIYAPEIPADSGPPAGASPAQRGREHDPLLTSREDKGDQEVLPTISELDLTGANALPDLHLDVHVYATKPSERFVYINMRKYQEGNTLAEGPVLERIRRDGVVLNYRGLRFLLPRQ
jgi:general secretion pathway protein B